MPENTFDNKSIRIQVATFRHEAIYWSNADSDHSYVVTKPEWVKGFRGCEMWQRLVKYSILQLGGRQIQR